MATLKYKKSVVRKALKNWSEDSYCKYALAETKEGNGSRPKREDTAKWCASGRLILVSSEATATDIDDDFKQKYMLHVTTVNDIYGYNEVFKNLEGLYK